MSDQITPVGVLTEEQAKALTAEIRSGVEDVKAKLSRAWHGRADAVLGYATWDAYCSSEFGRSVTWRGREDRRELGAELRSEGMSTRAIGSAVGVSHSTIVRDLRASGAVAPVGGIVRSLDDRMRPAFRPPADTRPDPSIALSSGRRNLLRAQGDVNVALAADPARVNHGQLADMRREACAVVVLLTRLAESIGADLDPEPEP